MKNYLKSNLTRKLFLLICTALIAISLILCVLFAIIMPPSLKAVQSQRFTRELNNLMEQIQISDLYTADTLLEIFSLQSNIVMALGTEDRQHIKSYGNKSFLFDNGNISFTTGEEIPSNTSLSGQTSYDIQIENNPYTIVVSGSNTETVNEVSMAIRNIIPVILLIVLFIALSIYWYLSRFITKPIKKIGQAAKQIAALNFNVYCEENRTDEFGQLSGDINTLAKTLDATLHKLNEELQFEKVLEEKQRLFFASASHELKTPLTIMKSKIEGMICGYGDYKDRDVYLASTLRTAGELEQLINEILALSQITTKSEALKKETISLKETIEDIIDSYADLTELKQLCFHIVLDHTTVIGDGKLLTKAIQNIISNAVYYSPDGAIIKVILSKNIFSVENFGVTLTKEDCEKLCEPFYRVDKSRNKKTGGSGLGLHFVKNILELHNFLFEIMPNDNSVLVRITFNFIQTSHEL